MFVMAKFIVLKKGMMRTCETTLPKDSRKSFEYLRRNRWLNSGRKVFVSFGGLLLYMEGPYKNLTPLRIDYVYLCIKK